MKKKGIFFQKGLTGGVFACILKGNRMTSEQKDKGKMSMSCGKKVSSIASALFVSENAISIIARRISQGIIII